MLICRTVARHAIVRIGVTTALVVGICAVASATEVELDGLKSRAPATWQKKESTSRFRVVEFVVPRAQDDKADAELVIFYFGAGQGGSAQENVRRWKSMFEPPAGKNIENVSKVDKFQVGTVPVTYLEVFGTYLQRARPFDPNSPVDRRENYRMLAVVFESKKRPVFYPLGRTG